MFSLFRRLLFVVFSNMLLLSQPYYFCAAAANISNIPEDSTKILPLATEQSVSTFLPSSAAPGNGLALNIIYPTKIRYKEGAPIAVVVPGGDAPSGLGLSIHAAQVGFIEVRFAFPGGGLGTFKSGSYNDYRGAKSQKALRDILLFVAGKVQDFRHRSIAELLPIKTNTNNIGVVGWSNGGNITLVTMEKYSTELDFIKWLALYECPLGSLFFPPSLGSTHDFILNNHYRQGSAATGRCLIDFRKLAWQADAHQNPGVHKKLGEPDLAGVIYFDDNQNGKWDETVEFAFNYCLDKGLNKQIYPPDITAAMERLNIFGPKNEKSSNEITATPTTTNASAKDNTITSTSSVTSSSTTNTIAAIPPNNQTSTNSSNSSEPIGAKTQASSTSKLPAKPQLDAADKAFAVLKAAGKWRKDLERKGIINSLSINQYRPKSAVKPTPSDEKSKIEEESKIEEKSKTEEKKNALKNWPFTVATLEESEAYFQERDGSLSIASVCNSYPNLLVTIIAGQVDHLQSQPDHPHIVLQYNAWLENNAHWVRINPESIYLASLANMGKSNFAQNPPNAPIEAVNITDYLEPAGALKDYVYADATIAELADRCQFKNYDSPLIEPIYNYDNGTKPIATTQINKNDKEVKK